MKQILAQPSPADSAVAAQPALAKLVIIGTGLIGASFALGLKRAKYVAQIVGLDRSEAALAQALQLGIIDQASTDPAQALADADLVVLAAPVAQTGAILRSIAPHLQPQTVVTDCGSTKSDVVEVARAVLADKLAQFVPAHPIAGRELNGPAAALADLYQGKKLIICRLPENTEAQIARVKQAWQACGAVIHELSAAEHDAVFAAVSHLPHLLAYTLVAELSERSNAALFFDYAASGFRDFTRIAGSSPEMWRDISLANRDAILTELDAYLAHAHRLRSALLASDGAALIDLYSKAQAARLNWGERIEAAEKAARDGGD